jgi:hypothetical protein
VAQQARNLLMNLEDRTVTVPLPEIAHEDGTPRSGFMNQTNRAFDTAEARNANNPGYTPHPAGAPAHMPSPPRTGTSSASRRTSRSLARQGRYADRN